MTQRPGAASQWAGSGRLWVVPLWRLCRVCVGSLVQGVCWDGLQQPHHPDFRLTKNGWWLQNPQPSSPVFPSPGAPPPSLLTFFQKPSAALNELKPCCRYPTGRAHHCRWLGDFFSGCRMQFIAYILNGRLVLVSRVGRKSAEQNFSCLLNLGLTFCDLIGSRLPAVWLTDCYFTLTVPSLLDLPSDPTE